MRPGTRRTSVTLLAAVGLLTAGCAQGGLAQRPFMVGTLKSELARAEQEKLLYRRQASELEAENARIAHELTQERAFSSDLEARLADARELLDRRGLAADPSLPAFTPAPSYAEREPAPRARTQPAGDSPRSRPRAPFAQISGGIRTTPAPDGEEPGGREHEFREDFPRALPEREPPAPRGPSEPPIRWLPVADSTGG